MKKSSKVVVTIVAIVVFILLFSVIAGVSSDAGQSTPGILGLILFAALFGAIRAIWKKSDDNGNGAIEKK
ncbi:MAG: hypothetical protein IKI72_05515 [Bacteroidales bacterium]|nr:hypothetical protein [Bacteroidales bacterium]